MVKEGRFEQVPMEAVFGLHNWPGMKGWPVCGRPAASDGLSE
jgi:hypothetical protein